MKQEIGRYEIISELGRGGMAIVYLGFDPRFRREVAIKVLPRQFTFDAKFLERFEREAQMIAALEHPAIVPVHDFGEEDDAPYLVMRYMSGGSLRARMDGEPLPLREISRILDRLAPALDKAHKRSIIHRDLKPGNVLFDDDDLPYLADFGIARLAEATHTMTVVGTPAYMSPEQVQGKLKLDWRSDIYALGVTLFEMMTGKQPYTAETPSGQMFMHAMEPIPDVRSFNAGLTDGAQLIVNRAMAKDREERYQTAVEVAEAVQQLLTAHQAAIESSVLVAAPTILEVDVPAINMEQPEEVVLAEAGDVTVLDAPPEGLIATEMLDSAVEEKIPDSAPAPRPVDEQRRGKRVRLPARVWLIGGFAVVLLVIFGVWTMFWDGGDGTTEAEEEGEPVLGSVWKRPKDQMKMVYVPPGTFPMGSEDGDGDEFPIHDVTLDGFWIDRSEVSNEQFAEFVSNTGYVTTAEEIGSGWIATEDDSWDETEGRDWQHPQGPASDLGNMGDHPVVLVSWRDAAGYCEWAGGALPTEAQWEYAARGPDGLKYPWGEDFDGKKANYCDKNCALEWKDESSDDGYAQTAPVGSYPEGSSWAGALDMAGNVWEWVNDWYDSDYYAKSAFENPKGPFSGSSKVLRGGGWISDPIYLRGASRGLYLDPVGSGDPVGFRCVSPGG